MKIHISSNYKPYTHSLGKPLVLPASNFCLKIYPQKIVVDDLYTQKSNVLTIKNNLIGPVKDFTVQQNINGCFVDVWGFTKCGYFGYRIQALQNSQGLTIKPLGQTQKAIAWELDGEGYHNRNQDCDFFSLNEAFEDNLVQACQIEILNLGNNKQQDWDLIHRRFDLTEILPLWYALGQRSPNCSIGKGPSLFSQCEQTIVEKQNDQIEASFMSLYRAGFTGMLCPQLYDTNYQGFTVVPIESTTSLALLSEGAKLIRSLFVTQNDLVINLLKALPPQFDCGRMVNVNLDNVGTFDLEWTKKTIRRLIIRATHNTEIKLNLQSKVKEYRMLNREGLHGIVKTNGDFITLKEDHTYFFDNFKK